MKSQFFARAPSFAIILATCSAFSAPSHRRFATIMDAAAGGGGCDHPRGRDIVVVGGGIQGTACAFELHRSRALPPGSTITILEANGLASAASGKGGGFMARSWGDGTDTQALHELAFDMYETLSVELGVKSYRKLPVIGVSPGPDDDDGGRRDNGKRHPQLADIIPRWLDGSVGRISPMGAGDDTAQVTPGEFVEKMMEYVNGRPGIDGPGVKLVIGTCVGIESSRDDDDDNDDGVRVVTGVRYRTDGERDELTLRADDVIVAAGPWACTAEGWFGNVVKLPMEGVKSTSIVWRPPVDECGRAMIELVDATALFCGEDDRFGTHLEVYPRPDGTVYICGIGGSDYVTTSELQASAFLDECPPKSDRVEAALSAFHLMSNSYATKGELSHAQACMRPCPPDAKPYMGKINGWSGAYINAGHNCWGIAWAPACGKAIAELVLEGYSRSVNLKPFDPARFTSGGRGGRGRKKGTVNVGEQW
ncbi:hypothetical protein ACHAW5_006633 [Stephanodiscus triporus]|uniref:FAD dependent oxidoreductase domain-containing protein n=1 Tax=Stephanodiscus triporus TaxID=2934178 RepID=A0ABD3NBE9_9STRA